MKIKISFLNNISAAIILACISLSACGTQAPIEKDTADTTSSVAETTQSVATESADNSSSIDVHSERFNELKEKADGEKIEYNEENDCVFVGFERTGDNEITSYDGSIVRSFEYEINNEENTLILHSTTVNNSKEEIELDCRPIVEFSDRYGGLSKTTVFKGTKIPAESSVTDDHTLNIKDDCSDVECNVFLEANSADTDEIRYVDFQGAGKFELILSSSETDSEKNPLEEYAYKVEYDQLAKKHIYIGIERVSDNEVRTKDGRLSRKFDYVVNEETNSIDFTVTSTNHSDEDIVIEKRAWIEVRTDLTDPDKNFAMTTQYDGIKIEPGESVEYTRSWELEDGWSTADVMIDPYIQLPPDTEVAYGGEPDGDSTTFEFTITA